MLRLGFAVCVVGGAGACREFYLHDRQSGGIPGFSNESGRLCVSHGGLCGAGEGADGRKRGRAGERGPAVSRSQDRGERLGQASMPSTITGRLKATGW